MAEEKAAVALFGLPPAGRAQFAALLGRRLAKPVIVLCASDSAALRFAADASFFSAESGYFPARDLTLRPVEGQSREYEHRRLESLGDMVGGRANLVTASVEGALLYTLPKDLFVQNTRTVKTGEKVSPAALVAHLVAAGYVRRPMVEGSGQFSQRGDILDIFPPDSQRPVRLSFWGDEIEEMHAFDLLSQRRDLPQKKLHISPATETLAGDAPALRGRILAHADTLKGKEKQSFLAAAEADLAMLEDGLVPSDTDKYLPVLFAKPGSLFSYFEDFILFLDEPTALREAERAARLRLSQEVEKLQEEGRLGPGQWNYAADFDALLGIAKKQRAVYCENFTRTLPDIRLSAVVNAPAHALPLWNGSFGALQEDLQPLLQTGYTAQVVVPTRRAAEALRRDMGEAGIAVAAEAKTAGADASQNARQPSVFIEVGELSAGVQYPFARFAVFAARGKAIGEPKRPRPKKPGLGSLDELKIGDYVVHQNHGVGVYSGIERVEMQGATKDYIKIAYAKGDTLFVPATQLDVLSAYTAPGDSEKVPLARLGTGEWQKTKTRVKKAAQDMAKELLELYARRAAAPGTAFGEDGDWQRDFEERFEYEETEDQLRSVQEIKKDMEQPHPMDRLLCGDVGVGKTEVALRAAFKAVTDGKQVAVLVPTTILAWQHYTTFSRRLEAFPVEVDMLSRFRTPKEQKKTLKNLAAGVCDIVIGTHRLLQKDVKFRNLGLLVVDEEQRFGVKHKEYLKSAFPGVDVLTLSATPIPRTLNMAMHGMRDMSTIEEPPVDRRPVETYVVEHDDALIAGAIRRELARGGQIYYLHNRIDTITEVATKLQRLVPECRIGIAHGKMSEQELSATWQKLLDADIDMLVCTTLIETGVDVPNCNTLIVEDADRMGLSQLYQIRGRVGRSGRKAYAYFTFRRDKVLTDVAEKRLSAIREFTNFGSGFRIAMRDLQIRGAGNLLGQDQHGQMEAVGYDLYVKMLARAVSELKGEAPPPDKAECLIDITADAYIPEDYIEQSAGRIEMYKRIAAIESQQDLEDVADEIKDRYGDIPKPVKGLMDISFLRVLGAKLGFYEIVQRGENVLFYSDSLPMDRLRQWLPKLPSRILVNTSKKPYLSARAESGERSVDVIRRVLTALDAALASPHESGYTETHAKNTGKEEKTHG